MVLLKEMEKLCNDDLLQKMFQTFPPNNKKHNYESVKEKATKKAFQVVIFVVDVIEWCVCVCVLLNKAE